MKALTEVWRSQSFNSLYCTPSVDFHSIGPLLSHSRREQRIRMKISVVIPVYNEAATVAELISRVQAVDISKEIIMVDDGSTDGTRERLAQLERQYDNLRIFLQPKN